MWIVRLALARPYTFVVMAMLIFIVGVMTIIRVPKDIFPDIDIPVISVVWGYGGLTPEEMEQRIVTNYERALTTTVNDIEHIESQSLSGLSVIKIFFQPGAHIEAATAQVTAISQTVVRMMPAGTTPPFIIRYSASNVPIMQMALGSESLSEQQLFDFGTNFIRADMAMVPGVQIPWRASSASHPSISIPRNSSRGACLRGTSPTPFRRRTSYCQRERQKWARTNTRSF